MVKKMARILQYCWLKMADVLFFSMAVAMKAQPRWEVMDRADVFFVGTALMVAGTVLVVSSFLALGFTGTFLGTYQTTYCRQSFTDLNLVQTYAAFYYFSCVDWTQMKTTFQIFLFGNDDSMVKINILIQ